MASTYNNEWDNLSIEEKRDVIRVALKNGIRELPDIKAKYNEFAGGGSFYQKHRARWNNYLLRHGVPEQQAAKLSSFFSAQDALESDHGTSDAARRKNNFGGMQYLDKKSNKMVNISYPSIDAYMDAKWKMMRNRFGRALNANSIQEYSNLLNDPRYHGKGYMYALYEGYRDGKPLDVAKQTQHMNNYTRILMDIAGEKGFKGAPVPAGQTGEAPASIARPENPYTQYTPAEPFFNQNMTFVRPEDVRKAREENALRMAESQNAAMQQERKQSVDSFNTLMGLLHTPNNSNSGILGTIATLASLNKNNRFDTGGNKQQPRQYIYDIIPSLFAKDGVKITVSSGFRPGAKTVEGKPSRHSLRQAADIVGDFKAIRRVLDDPNSYTSRWLLANGYGYLDETSATGTTKFWHDHKRDHSHYHIGMDSGIASKYANMMGGRAQNPLPEQDMIEQPIELAQASDIPFTPSNPQAFFGVHPAQQQSVYDYVTTPTVEQPAYDPMVEEKNDALSNLSKINAIMQLTSPSNNGNNNFLNTVGLLANMSAEGGKIHIKPENRGKFTALKKRTGHSATWFKEHGTPAQKKMATFALNAAKWKHGDGGNLYPDGGWMGKTMRLLADANKLADMGEKVNRNKPKSPANSPMITTGGAGYIPDTQGIVKEVKNAVLDYAFGDNPKPVIRRRLYDNISPYSYANALYRVHNAVVNNRKEKYRDYIGDQRDDIFAEYLQIPKEQRHKTGLNYWKLHPAKYKPSLGRNNTNYFSLSLPKDVVNDLYNDVYFGTNVRNSDGLNIGENTVSETIDPLGRHTIGRGHDSNGEYMSYYDSWDLTPYGGGLKDQSFGIGKPVHIYDRIYLDDYFGVPSPYRGSSYLPEVTITGKRRRGKKHGYGGHIYDGTTEDSQQMNIPFEIVGKGQLNPELNYGNITVGGRKGTLLSANYDTNLGRIKYDDGTEEDVQLARNFWANSKNNNSNSAVNKTLTGVVPQYSWDRDSYLAQQSRIDEEVGNRLPNIDRTITGLSNLWNYSKGYLKNKFNGDDSGILLNLADKNVSRIMSNTGDIETILTNDFVENNNNMVRKKKDFINTTDTLLGDKKIPLSKISTFYGIEDGKLKAGPLDIFNDETVVVPNRAKYVGKIKEYHASTPATEAFREAVNKDIENYNNLHNYTPSLSQLINSILTFSKPKPSGTLHSNVGLDKAIDIQNYFEEKHKKLGAPESPYVITENNDTIRGYELNASPKALFADEKGNAVFVSSPRQHVEELNSYLKEHPMYPIMVDNGRYASYQTDFPNAEVYGGLNRPNNMFILGTTKKKALGGNLYGGTTEDSQQMNTPRYRKLLDAEIKEELSDNDVMELPLAAELSDVRVTGKKKRNVLSQIKEHWVTNDKGEEVPTYWGYNPDTKQLEQLYRLEDGKSADESVFFTPDGGWSYNVPQAAEMRKAHEQWVKNGGNASNFDKVILKYLMAGVAPIALPEIAAGALTPTGQTLLAGTLGGEAWEALNQGITGQSWGDNLGDVIGLDKDNYLGRTALGLTNPFYFTSPSMIYKGGAAAAELGKSMWNAGKEGLQYTAKAADNVVRGMSPSYDLYRTIGETPVSRGSLQKSLTEDFGIFEGPKRVTFFDTPYRQRLDDSFNLVKESAEAPKQYGMRFAGKYGDSPEVLGKDGMWYGDIAYFKNKKFSDPIDNSIIVGKESRYRPEDYLFHYDRGNYPVYYNTDGTPMLHRLPDWTEDLGPIWWNKNSKWGDRSVVSPRLIKAPDYGKYRQPLSGDNIGDSEAILTGDYPLGDAEFLERDDLVGTMGRGIFAQQPTPKTIETPTIEWAEAARTPQITAENAADDVLAAASDNPFKYDVLKQYFTRRRYSDKIHGKPTESFLDFDPATGDFVKSSERFAPDVIKGLPKHIQEDLMHNTVGRNMDAFINEGVTAEEAQAYIDKAKKAMEDVHVGRYSKSDYEKAGFDRTGGFYDDKNNFISVNEGSGFPEGRVEKHEGRHLIDYQADDAVLMPEITGSDYDADRVANLMQRAKQKQNMVLGDAYDNDFLTIPESKFADGLESYSHMSREAVTTNRDARDVLFAKHNFGKQDRLLQNKYIDKMSDDDIFDAVSKANGYGRRFIERLKAEGKLTPKKAKQFREAMKYVGAVATPVGVGLTAAGIASKTSDKK